MSEREQFELGKERARAVWEVGDYDGCLRSFDDPRAKDFAEFGELPRGRVLDVACGTGASSFPLARRGFTVTGIDLSPRHLAVARRDAAEQGLSIAFDEGFLEEMPYADASFDAAVSVFGIMFSPAPQMAIAEVARVLKPGARLVLANWTPTGLSGRMGGLLARHLPPMPAGAASPFDWGDADRVRGWLSPSFEDIATNVVQIEWSVDANPVQSARRFIETAGPVQFVQGSLSEAQREEFTRDFERFWADNNRSQDPDTTVVQNEFMKVSAVRR